MEGLGIVVWMAVLMAVLTVLVVVFTVCLKAMRVLGQSLRKSYYRRIEPALEDYLLTGEVRPELRRLRSWEKDRYLATLMVERIALLRGSDRELLTELAEDLGLVEIYLADLRSRRRWKRARAAENLGYFGHEEVLEPVSALLVDGDETVRAVAARTLARVGTRTAAEKLVRILDDPSDLTRLRSAENLERIGEPALEPLTELLLSLMPRGVVLAAQVLGNMRDSRARPALISALLNAIDQDALAQIILALGKIGDPDDVLLISRVAKSESWPVRAQAANALGLIGEVSTIPTLVGLAADHEWWVRLNACKALANIGPSGEAALVELLAGDDPYASNRAAAVLESDGVIRRMVRDLARDGKRGDHAKETIETIIRSGHTLYLGGLLETMRDGPPRDALARMLEEIDPYKDPASAGSEPGPPAPDEPATDWARDTGGHGGGANGR